MARRGLGFALEDIMVPWVYLGEGSQMDLVAICLALCVTTFSTAATKHNQNKLYKKDLVWAHSSREGWNP